MDSQNSMNITLGVIVLDLTEEKEAEEIQKIQKILQDCIMKRNIINTVIHRQ